MIVNRQPIKDMVKKGKLCKFEDLNEVLRGIIKEVVETAMEAELTSFLGYEKHQSKSGNTDNSRNGYGYKELTSKLGPIVIEPPRDRLSEFEPVLVKKRKKDIMGFEEMIISMYGKGMSTRDIQSHIKELYGQDISPETVSRITDGIIERAREWQNRPLMAIYPIVFMDAIFLKLRQDGHVRNIAVYLMIGIDISGKKDCLGIWIGTGGESSKFWLGLLNEIKHRGVQEILIFSVDGLNGFPQAIGTAFPMSEVQHCIVHQVRHSLKHVSWKDRKEVAESLKAIYQAPTEDAGLIGLEAFEEKWGKKYQHIVASWQRNWDELATFFKYPEEIRRLIYTTNPIESLNSRIKKVTRVHGVFPTETALFKVVFLAVEEANKRWTTRIKDWPNILAQLTIFFKDRIEKYLEF